MAISWKLLFKTPFIPGKDTIFIEKKDGPMSKNKSEHKENMITIDGKDYDLNTMSTEAKAQLASIQFVDGKVQQLNNERAVAETARVGYSNALQGELSKIEAAK